MSDFNWRLWVNQGRTWASVSPVKCIIFRRVPLKNSLFSYSATENSIVFAYGLILVSSMANLMLFLGFVGQNIYPGEFLNQRLFKKVI